MKTHKIKRTKTKTVRRKKQNKISSNKGNKKSHIVAVFLEFLTTIKLYHWKTLSYPQHKATDELYGRMQDNIDKFVEVLLGKDEERLRAVNQRLEKTLNVKIQENSVKTQDEFQTKVLKHRKFLNDLDIYFERNTDSDLLNIRDELLADLNQFLYLFALH
jgi:DNA-binding ferritin-like protein